MTKKQSLILIWITVFIIATGSAIAIYYKLTSGIRAQNKIAEEHTTKVNELVDKLRVLKKPIK